ncbi:MAG TPA: prepilin-type N-terminal cleavage/methylation domain-containing protein [Thermodesulfovibrionales bacterium]|nr:prepilin-type N-terminal cleavage/methylation domain-containing protein [Thermodesulfovibrionales bacterium]
MPPCTPSLTSLAPGKEADAGAGFTLLELLIVLALVTLVVGISTVFLVNTLPASKLNATARDISSTIRYARTLAQTNNEQQVMTIDLDSNRYGIEGRGDRNIPPGMHIKVMDPFSGEIRNGTYQMRFHAFGTGGATVVVWNDKRSVSIQVDPITGPVITK